MIARLLGPLRSALARRQEAWTEGPVTVRSAYPDDWSVLASLALADGQPPLSTPILVAEAGDQLLAALSLADGRAIADPRRPSGALILQLADAARTRRP